MAAPWPARAYRVREQGSSSKGYSSYVIGLPKAIGEVVVGRDFSADFTDEGILLRLVETLPANDVAVPAWARKEQS